MVHGLWPLPGGRESLSPDTAWEQGRGWWCGGCYTPGTLLGCPLHQPHEPTIHLSYYKASESEGDTTALTPAATTALARGFQRGEAVVGGEGDEVGTEKVAVKRLDWPWERAG